MSLAQQAAAVVDGLGGVHNVLSVEGCITRLRTTVADPARIDETSLKAAGALAVIVVGEVAQVVVGPHADDLADAVAALL